MNQEEITQYLAASHIAVVATMNRHGHPHLTPNWYRYDGKVLTLITRTDRLKYLNLQRDNHISVCIYDPPVASSRATGHRMRWTTMWRAGKRSHGCSSR